MGKINFGLSQYLNKFVTDQDWKTNQIIMAVMDESKPFEEGDKGHRLEFCNTKSHFKIHAISQPQFESQKITSLIFLH